jgi:flagellar assembly protein FliH
MRLQFETEGKVELLELPEEMDGCPREIAPLEFRLASSAPVPIVSEVSPAGVDETHVSTSEIAVLQERLRLQAVTFRAQVDDARREGAEAARVECFEEYEHKIRAERDRIGRFLIQFGRERAHYFASAEGEVVKLSLAIAAQILHREAKMDPLLLKGAVRVALDGVEEVSTAVVRVPEADVELWRATVDDCHQKPQVVGDSRLTQGECLLESSVGSANLGASAQLKEIERGFFDLLEKRPA